MKNIASRLAYSRHVLRSFKGGFVAMSYSKFVRMGMFSV